MTSVSKNVYIDKSGNMVYECNNTSHRAIKMKPVNVQASTCIDFGIENNRKDPRYKVGDHIRISKYKHIFEKCYALNWSEEYYRRP